MSVLSINIETDPEARRLFSLALYGCGASEVLLVNPGEDPVPEGTRSFPGQEELMQTFARRIQELDPDVLTGWNVVDFDLQVLERLAGASGFPCCWDEIRGLSASALPDPPGVPSRH